ncbi:MAG: daunorubicin resistance transporter, inner rane subunit [Bacteroidetes bacterium]|nr:daunorubicin resistance transporter, inner rane subunit [Bacteroidota bacterium]
MTMILAVMYREYRIRKTSLTWLFYDLFMPLTYLLLFGIGLDRAFAQGIPVPGGTVSYNAFFLSGVLAMACFGIAINTSYGFFVDRDNGIFYEFLTYPMTRAQFLIGKIVFNCLMSLAQATLTVVLGVLLLGIPFLWSQTVFVLLGVALGTAGWFFFLATFALRIRRNDMFNTFINVAYFVLMFASSLFYPLDQLPSWLRIVSWINPMTWHTDALRYATIGVGDVRIVVLEATAFALFLLLSFGAALQTIRRAILR